MARRGFRFQALYKQKPFLYINLIGRNEAVHVLEEDPVKHLSFFALAASAVCAVAFSPGPELGLALIVIALTAVLCVLAVPWLKSTFLTSTVGDLALGHGHMHSRAFGHGAGGRHGPPRSIIFALAVWALILQILTSPSHAMARTNTAAQPLPS